MSYEWMSHVQWRILILYLCKRLRGCMRMSHVTRMNQLCCTARVNESCPTYEVMLHTWTSHVPLMNESSSTYGWDMFKDELWFSVSVSVCAVACEQVMSHVWMNESCPTYELVMSHVWIGHVPQTNEACPTYEWVMSHVWIRHVPRMNEWVMSHVRMSHVPRMNTPGHIYKWGNFRREHKFLSAWASTYCHASVSCPTYEWVVPQIWRIQATRVNKSCHADEWIVLMSCVNELCYRVVLMSCVNELC